MNRGIFCIQGRYVVRQADIHVYKVAQQISYTVSEKLTFDVWKNRNSNFKMS